MKVKVKSLSCVRLFATPWTVGGQAPPSMEFSRQEYWSGLPFPSPGDLPNSGIEPGSPALQADALLFEPPLVGGQLLYNTVWKLWISCADAHTPSLLSPTANRPHATPGSARAPHWAPCVHSSSHQLRLTPGSVYPSILLSQFVPPSTSPAVATDPFCLLIFSCPGNRFIGTIRSIFQETK